jgi:hypothetical protein
MRAIVVGRSAAALEEYEAARALGVYDAVIVVGAMVVDFPWRVDHLVSWHAVLFAHWARKRASAGHPPLGDTRFWGARFRNRHVKGPPGMSVEYVTCVGGSSGFLAAHGVALGVLGATRVVLAGIPLEAGAGHFGAGNKSWGEADLYWQTWLDHESELRGRVRSMSGRTRTLLGAPDMEWLEEGSELTQALKRDQREGTP